MAKPIAPTPDVYGEEAEEILREMERADRCELTSEELELKKQIEEEKEEFLTKIKFNMDYNR